MKRKPLLLKLLGVFACFFIFIQAYTQVTINGNIRDENNTPLPGVTILEKGTNNGTVTDLDGNFSMSVKENAVLVVSYVGYLTEEVLVKGRTDFNIQLAPDIISLDDVVVVGYGTVKKSDLTGSVASVSGGKLTEMPAVGVDQALQGRAAGVSITSNTGMPGGSISIQIRGISSINGTEPLVIVDGVHSSLSNLNPGDIERVEILKDASSTAIYGSNGGNGVILVTTKKGASGKLITNFNAYWGFQQPCKKLELLNSQEYAKLANILVALKNINAAPFTTQPDTLRNYDWQDIMFRNALMENYDLSVTGGTEKSSYYVSANYQRQQGTYPKSDYDRISFRVNSDHKLSKLFKVGENALFVKSKHNGFEEWVFQNEYNSPLLGMFQMIPYVSPYDENGEWSVNPTGGTNPRVAVDVLDRVRNEYSIGGNAYVEFTPIKGLVYTSKVNAYTVFNIVDEFNRIYHYNPTVKNEQSKVSKSVAQQYGLEFQNYLNYNTSIQNHNIGFLVGAEAIRNKYADISGKRHDLINETPEMRYFNASTNDTLTTVQYVYGTGSEDAIYSYFGRFNYDYKGIILLTANFRHDVSSRFGPKYRKGNFPSVSAGWKFSELSFIKNSNFISFGKIRAGYGTTGANAPALYGYYSRIAQVNAFGYVFDHSNNIKSGAALQQMPNREMRWETMKMKNIGLDMSFFSNKLSLTIDLFQKANEGMLIYQNLPAIAGMYQNPNYVQQLGGDARPISNIGKINNSGIEFTIGYKGSFSALKYSVDFNGTFVRNKVIDIKGDSTYRGDVGVNLRNICLTAEGYPVSQFNGLKTDGLFTWADAAVKPNGEVYIWNQPYTIKLNGDTSYAQPKAKPGDLRYVDVNHDGKINNLDKVNIGSPIPKFYFGFSANLEYKNFDLNLFFEGKIGHKIFNGSKFYLMGQDPGPNKIKDVLKQYREPIYDNEGNLLYEGNTSTNLPRLDPKGENGNFTKISDFYVENGSYVRLKNIQLGYTIPVKMSQRVGIERLRIYVGAKNLLTITKYSGLDPEFAISDMLAQGIDKIGNYPQSLIVLGGINLTF